VQVTSGTNDIILATRHGLSVRFHEQDVREMGRDTTGVKGIELREGDALVGMVVLKRDATILVVTERGLGKCSNIDDYRVQRRGGKGIITVHRTEKTGDVIGVMEVLPADEIMLITRNGVIIRSSVAQVRVTGRIAQGVRLVHLDEGDLVTAVARVVPEENGDSEGDDSVAPEDAVAEASAEES
jgi:DNA gyrase subunit A